MNWTVEFHSAFEAEFDALSRQAKTAIAAKARLLEEFVPQLGRPHADTLEGSKHANTKELRCNADDGALRRSSATHERREIMGTTLKEKIAQLDPDHQAEIAAEFERLRAEYLTLKDLRKARELTQVQLAETLGQKQVSIAKLEKRTDLLLSTLRRYVEAMGGKLTLLVEFPDRPPVLLDGIGGVDEPASRRKKHGEAHPA